MTEWTAKRSDAQQSALFDVCMGEIVSSLKAVDQVWTCKVCGRPFVSEQHADICEDCAEAIDNG